MNIIEFIVSQLVAKKIFVFLSNIKYQNNSN